MRRLLILLFWIPSLLYGQNHPNEFSIGDYLEVFEGDSLRVYFSCTGTVISKKCAEYYRVGRTDEKYINYVGDFTDYYITGKIALNARMIDNFLDGPATYYFSNGIIKATGSYSRDKKVGVWKYYYKNGKLQKIINFKNGIPHIEEYYNRIGKQKVFQGDGKYTGIFYANKACDPFVVKGSVKNGRPNGEWELGSPSLSFTIAWEYFKDGEFVEGRSSDIDGDYTYTEFQKVRIDSYIPNEGLHLEDNSLGCPGDYGIFWPKYNETSLIDSYYPDLQDSLKILATDINIKNQWLIIGLNVTSDGSLNNINVWSSINDTIIENHIFNILSAMNNFSAFKSQGKPKDSDMYYSILFRENAFIIPKLYIIQNMVHY